MLELLYLHFSLIIIISTFPFHCFIHSSHLSGSGPKFLLMAASVVKQPRMDIEDGNSNSVFGGKKTPEDSNGPEVPELENPTNEIPPKSVTVKWSGKEYVIEDINGLKTVGDLKVKIMEKTRVKVDRQKLLNLMYMGEDFKFLYFQSLELVPVYFVVRCLYLK